MEFCIVCAKIRLHRKKKKHWQYVVLASLIKQVLQVVHDKAGHQVQAKMLYLARESIQ